jgi:hypothetical protein
LLNGYQDSFVGFIRKLLPILALIALSDVHWGVMQVVIWIDMTVEAVANHESALSSIQQSITGEKKCPHCRQLEAEREKENEQAVQWEGKQLGLNFTTANVIIPPVKLFENTVFEDLFGNTRHDAPITPPPWS